ncbi:PilN domain-containing protein [Dyella tabacisoli]|uniref:Fimbrial assembly protein n=1 Tax=Dyella tabacisoli TaxID=2282381 RepID=A0A369UUC4_9GAMM|nr:PilN domain-containing protein [Dyella tabacisoli]RDD81939.1 fimbrial assembly protein [Dyella tabacisoli]
MAQINLLPWRAERRKQREREFYMQLVAALVAALAFLLIWALWMGERIETQNGRNSYLQTEIKLLDDRIVKIKDLEKVRERLLARKQIIEQLQANRSQMVHLFDELVKTIPSSGRLAGLKQSGDSMTLDGVAQSNASVAEYMRNIEASQWMGHADLRKTENTHGDSRMPYTFGLDVALSRPKSDETVDPDHAPIMPAAAASAATPPATASSAAARQAPVTAAKTATSSPATAAPATAAPVTAAPATAPKPAVATTVVKPTPAAASGGAKP